MVLFDFQIGCYESSTVGYRQFPRITDSLFYCDDQPFKFHISGADSHIFLKFFMFSPEDKFRGILSSNVEYTRLV